MTIGLALAGFAAIAAAAHPRGARTLMGLMGTPEEHLAKFYEYLAFAQNTSLPLRIRVSAMERAFAEAEWAKLSEEDKQKILSIQSELDTAETTSSTASPVVLGPVTSSRGFLKKGQERPVDKRHPPAGWKRGYVHYPSMEARTVNWLFVSLGGGQYEAKRGGQVIYKGTGNKVLETIAGHTMDFYKHMGLGKPGAVFNPDNPPPGWYKT